jgi:hypothetical protein
MPLFSVMSRPALGPDEIPIQLAMQGLSQRIKQQGKKQDTNLNIVP